MRRYVPVLAAILLLGTTPAALAAPDMQAALAAAVAPCWHPPQGAAGTVSVLVELGQDGKLAARPRTTGLASVGLARAAVNAVELCQPYRLPPIRYSDWKRMAITLKAGG